IPTPSCSAPVLRFGTLVLALCAAWTSPLASERQVLTFRTRAWLSFAPPMPDAARAGFRVLPSCSRSKGHPPVSTSSNRFSTRHQRFACARFSCRDQVPTFPQRSPPSLLTTAACGGLRPAPDCRPRRALLHLSYGSALSYSDSAFVTHAPMPTFRRDK